MRCCFRSILAWAALTLPVAGASAVTLPPPTLSNPSFSSAGANGMPLNWSLSHEGHPSNVTAGRDVSVYKSAPASLRIESGPSGHTEGFVMGSLPVFRLKGPFTVQGWGKAESGLANVVVQIFVKSSEEGAWHDLGVIDSPDWQQWSFSYEITEPQADLNMGFLNFFLSSEGSKVWVDDVSLVLPTGVTYRIDSPAAAGLQAPVPAHAITVLGLDGRLAGAVQSGLSIQRTATSRTRAVQVLVTGGKLGPVAARLSLSD